MSQDYNMNYVSDSKQRYSDVDVLSTQGRIGRKRYFVYSTLLPALIFWAIASIAALASYVPIVSTPIFYGIMGIAIIAALWMMVHLTIQRCHDFNKGSALALLAFIPFANIFFALAPGTNGLNSYGEVPKPASFTFKVVFYGLILLLLSAAMYAVTQLPLTQMLNNMIAF